MNGDFLGETPAPMETSLTTWIDSLGGAAGNVLSGLKGRMPSPVAGNPSATGTAKAQAWMPFVLIGGAVLLVIVLVVSLSKR